MPMKLYRIESTINHHDNLAGFAKDDKDVYAFFKQNKGEEEKIRKRDLRFIAGKGYNLSNIDKTDFIKSSTALLFSKKFYERLGEKLSQDMLFIPCKLMCDNTAIDWYAVRIKNRAQIVDEEASTYRTLSDGTKIIQFARYKKDVSDTFYIAEDTAWHSYYRVSELFKELCDTNDIHISFKEPEITF